MSLFALLMAVSLFAFSYISYQQTASSQPQMAGMKFMMVYLMPVMMLFWFNSYSSGLCFYYLLANLLTIGQTLLIRRMVDDDKIHAAMKANAAAKAAEGTQIEVPAPLRAADARAAGAAEGAAQVIDARRFLRLRTSGASRKDASLFCRKRMVHSIMRYGA